MTPDQRLHFLRELMQRDVGARGLASDPVDNLLTARPDDFSSACRSIATHPSPRVAVVTGFTIPTVDPPRSETDGPLGALYLARMLPLIGIPVIGLAADGTCVPALQAGVVDANIDTPMLNLREGQGVLATASHVIAIERVGPSRADGRCYTMRGRDVTPWVTPTPVFEASPRPITIGIGDGGNEIGMGAIPWGTIEKNIPNGRQIACRVATDYLLVAGVSNWGAYALALGVAIVRGFSLPGEAFDLSREQRLLQTMVDAGPLVDGVTGLATPTVDGLTFDQYSQFLRHAKG